MAFLTIEDIQASLPVGFDTNYVARLLTLSKRKLEEFGLRFREPAVETRRIKASSDGQRLFSVWFMTGKPTEVKVGSFGSTHVLSLTEYTDYLVKSHPNVSGLYFQIETMRDFFSPFFLDVTASIGFMESVDDTLKAAITQWILKRLEFAKSRHDGRTIEKVRTDDTEIWYTEDSFENSDDITRDVDFNEVLNYYLPI